ncbi:hypothetical protein DPMN_027745 [Dreissena polymorpha]|uniref:Uncharacterized protein n=1 Tax=Dreissena polymorpha TaxID=45954 RepID=A0A9D4RDX5_DREPO|nr:hypothetical protein DPMN_027745 [Dreissena polymorpha]
METRHPHLPKPDKHYNGKRKDDEASSSKATYSSPSKSKKQKTQMKITDVVRLGSTTEHYSVKSGIYTKISRAIAVFMAKGLRPFSIVDDPGFCHMIACIDPKYPIPSRNHDS